MKLLVTGGAGFIGSHFIRYILERYKEYEVINLDKLTYAGNLENLEDLKNHPGYTFVQADICNPEEVNHWAAQVDTIINFAAESHVDRSILYADQFIQTDVHGTYVLLEAARTHGHTRYLQISTDEVYGSTESGVFSETDVLNPSSPYAASKAAGDMMVMAFHRTYQVPVLILRSANNFGPNQHPEKLIPLFVTNAIENLPLPIYGDGQNIRNWIYVRDHCEAIDQVLHHGSIGEIYNVAGSHERTNLQVTSEILKLLDKPESLIRRVPDRPGHDRRYALDDRKIRSLGFSPRTDFSDGLSQTVQWYRENPKWWQKIKQGKFQDYYKQVYRL